MVKFAIVGYFQKQFGERQSAIQVAGFIAGLRAICQLTMGSTRTPAKPAPVNPNVMHLQISKALRVSSIGLLAFLAFSIVVGGLLLLTMEFGRRDASFVGCFPYDALIIGFACQGFPGSNIAGLWLNWPVWLVVAPLFAVQSVKMLGFSLLAWSPVILFFVSRATKRRPSA